MPPRRQLAAGLLSRTAAHVVAIGALWLISLAFFWPLLTPDPSARLWVAPGDFTNQFFAFHSFTAQELWQGHLPLWNPYMYAGHPVLADIQSATFYPIGLLWCLIFGSDGLTLAELQYRVVFSYPLAGTFCYLLIWQLTRNRGAGLLGGLAFALGGFLTSYPLQQMPILETALWLPLALYFAERGAAGPAPVFWLLLGSATLATCVLAGHPQSIMYIAYTVSAYVVLRAWPAGGGSAAVRVGRWLTSSAWRLGLLWLFVLGLSAIQLLPSAEFIPLSNRSELPYAQAAIGYAPDSLLAILLPDWKAEHAPYVSILGLFLAGVGCWRGTHGSRWFWLAAAVVSGLVSLGGNGPLYPLLHAVAPGFALFRDQERAMLVFSLALAVLAGLGYAALAAGPRARHAPTALLLVPVALFVGGLTARELGYPEQTSSQVVYAALLAAAGASLLGWQLSRPLPARWWLPLAVGLVVADLWAVNAGSGLVREQPSLSRDATQAAAIVTSDAAARQEEPQFRVRVQTDDHDLLPENYGHIVDLHLIGGDSPFFQGRLLDLLSANSEWRLWQLLNVKYTLSRRALEGGLDYVGQGGQLRVYRMQWPVPRVWATRDVRFADSQADALRLTLSPDIAPGNAAVLEGNAWLRFADKQKPQIKYEITDYGDEHLAIQVQLDEDALLVVSEPYYPGWQATLDGQPATLYRGNYYLRALPVPAGRHEVTMDYAPRSIRLGAILSGTFLALLLGGLFVAARVKRR